MTEKDLHKLRRQDLLQLLLAQSREVAGQQERIRELEASEASLQALSERLKGKLKIEGCPRAAERNSDIH